MDRPLIEVKDPGYHYVAYNIAEEPLEIKFLKKVPKEEGSTELVTVVDGWTNEQLLGILIDRIGDLNKRMGSRYNSLAITKLEEGLHWLEERIREREARGVEGSHKA